MNPTLIDIAKLIQKIGFDHGTWINSPLSHKFDFITKDQFNTIIQSKDFIQHNPRKKTRIFLFF